MRAPCSALGTRHPCAAAVARVAAAKGVEMPITEQMVAVMYEGKNPKRAVEELMTRGLKSETEL